MGIKERLVVVEGRINAVVEKLFKSNECRPMKDEDIITKIDDIDPEGFRFSFAKEPGGFSCSFQKIHEKQGNEYHIVSQEDGAHLAISANNSVTEQTRDFIIQENGDFYYLDTEGVRHDMGDPEVTFIENIVERFEKAAKV